MSEQCTDCSRERSGNGRLEPSPAPSHGSVKPQWAWWSQLHRRSAYKSVTNQIKQKASLTRCGFYHPPLWGSQPAWIHTACGMTETCSDRQREQHQGWVLLVTFANGTSSNMGSHLHCWWCSNIRTQAHCSPPHLAPPSTLGPGVA